MLGARGGMVGAKGALLRGCGCLYAGLLRREPQGRAPATLTPVRMGREDEPWRVVGNSNMS
jgi:hypothetical protein